MNNYLPAFFLILYGFLNTGAWGINIPENISATLNREYDPAFSPNGRYIVYCVEVEGDENIWLLDLDNRKRRRITSHSASDYAPAFMGNSTILFVTRRGNSLGEIYKTDLNGKKQELIIGGNGYYDAPAPDGNGDRIAYIHNEFNDSVFIYIYDTKSKTTQKGPEGLDPEFFPSGDSVLFISPVGDNDKNELVIYSLVDSSVSYPVTRSGLILNPVIFDDGDRILYENKSRDTDGDGNVTINDDSDLMILNLRDKSVIRLLPGFDFANPDVSINGQVCAQDDDGKIHIFDASGITENQPDYDGQRALCDSLILHSLTDRDSLLAGVACYEAFQYYSFYCRDLVIKAALIFSGLNRFGLALEILADLKSDADSTFLNIIRLTEAKIRYRVSSQQGYVREKIKALNIIEELQNDNNLPDSVKKDVYIFSIGLYFDEGSYEKGKRLIERGKEIFSNDSSALALLERWELKYLVNTYAGDINDLIPLYIEMIEKYNTLINIGDVLIKDLIDLLSEHATGDVLSELEQLRSNYGWYPELAGKASLEQAKILAQQGRNLLAELRLKELLSDYPDEKGLRFMAFDLLFDIYVKEGSYEKAGAAIDSAVIYLGGIDNYQKRESFKKKASEYFAFSGYRVINSDIDKARRLFLRALSFDDKNYNAICGLAKTEYDPRKEERDRLSKRWSLSVVNSDYLSAASRIAKSEEKGNKSDLVKARDKLIAITETYPSFPLTYLSLGYVDCSLEALSREGQGLYEEAVEYSIRGISLIDQNSDLVYGFYLNLAESYFGLSQYNEAYKYYGMAREIKPDLENNPKFIKKYGESALYIDSLEVAGENFEKLYDISANSDNAKENSFAALKLGVLEQLRGRYIEAAEYYQKAKEFYKARNDTEMVTDILKAQAFCLMMTGDEKSASQYADQALQSFGQTKFRGVKYDNRIKFILWPFGISIPLIELLPMRYGGSLYPKGFTAAVNKAFLMELSNDNNDIISEIKLKNAQIDILDQADEDENSVDLWDQVGRKYLEIGYTDSSSVSFQNAFKLCMKLEDYHCAYIELLNWAEAVFHSYPESDRDAMIKQMDEMRDKALDLHEYILPSYPNARANLKNVAGLADYLTGMLESGKILEDGYQNLNAYMTNLDEAAGNIQGRFSNALYSLKDAMSELPPGDYPDIETGILINMAAVSYSLGDFENLRLSLKDAGNSAVLGTSPRLYARLIGIDAIFNDVKDEGYIESLEDAAGLYENMPAGIAHIIDRPYLEMIYDKIIEYYIEEQDVYSALNYLERMKRLFLTANMYQIRSNLYKSERFRANLDLLRRYQQQIIDLYMEKKRLEGMGSIGKIKLGEVNEEILKIRGRILDLREEMSELDIEAYSALVFDPPSVKADIENIADDQIYIVAHDIPDKTVIWLCRKDSLEMRILDDLDDPEISEALGDLSRYNIITIISSNDAYRKMKNVIAGLSPGIIIKRRYSLNDVGDTGVRDIRRVRGIAIIRFDGYILSDDLASDIEADIVYYDSTFEKTDLSKYGWIIFDGILNVDRSNFLFSSWGNQRIIPDNVDSSRLYLKNLPRLTYDGFGVIMINSSGILEDTQGELLNKLFDNMGVDAVLTMEAIHNISIIEKDMVNFFDSLATMAPLQSYHSAFDKSGIGDGIESAYDVTYYGENGWSIKEEEKHARDLFSEFVLTGNQYYVQKKWDLAERYYNQALRVMENREFDKNMRASVAWKLVETYRNTSDYDRKILNDRVKFIEEFGAAEDWEHLSSIFHDVARIEYDRNEPVESVRYASALITSADKINNVKTLADTYAIRGKALMEIGDLIGARNDFMSSLNLLPEGNIDDRLRLELYLVEILNYTEMYGEAKKRLDLIRPMMEGIDIEELMVEYSLQLARYNIGAYHNQTALDNLRLPLDRKNAEAAILTGKIYLLRGELDSAFDFVRIGLNRLIGNRKAIVLMEAHELLGDLYRITGDYESSLINYRLAEEDLADYQYRNFSGILRYKIALLESDENGKDDSLFNAILVEYGNHFLKNLCRYQLGRLAYARDDRATAEGYFIDILNAGDSKSLDYLVWRANYYLALMSAENDNLHYLETADSMIQKYPVEPDYIMILYEFHEARADLYNRLAEIMFNRGNETAAVNYLETSSSQTVSGRHFSIGNYDSTENRILDRMLTDEDKGGQLPIENIEPGFFDNSAAHRLLWGMRPFDVERLQDNLAYDEAIIRIFDTDSGSIETYVDKDSILIKEGGINEDSLAESLKIISDLLADQQKADSLMEKWYVEFISPFEDLLQDREKILVIAGGIFNLFPFETLKMPEGDYLSEMYTLKRHIYLPGRFPQDLIEDTILTAEFESGEDPDVGLIKYISQPLLKSEKSDIDRVSFYSGKFAFFDGSGNGNDNVICMVKPFSKDDFGNLELQAVLSARDGYSVMIHPLWDMSNEIKSEFYWKFVRELTDGKGHWKSYRDARSYIFGHYEGLPNLWGANVFMSLN